MVDTKRKKDKLMVVTMQFKAKITTKETYPYGLEVTFIREVKNPDDIFCEANEYIHKAIRNIISSSIYCEGVRIINYATIRDLDKLITQNIKMINGSNLL